MEMFEQEWKFHPTKMEIVTPKIESAARKGLTLDQEPGFHKDWDLSGYLDRDSPKSGYGEVIM